MVKSYCLRQRKQTECVPRSEKIIRAKNGRLMMECVCSECGLVKARFVTEGFANQIRNPEAYKNLPKKLVMPNIFEGPNDHLVDKAAKQVIKKLNTRKKERRKSALRGLRTPEHYQRAYNIKDFNPKNPLIVGNMLGKVVQGVDDNTMKVDRKIINAIIKMNENKAAEGRRIAKKVLPVPPRVSEEIMDYIINNYNLDRDFQKLDEEMLSKRYQNAIDKMPKKPSRKPVFSRLSTDDVNPDLDRKYQASVNKMLQSRYNKLIRKSGN